LYTRRARVTIGVSPAYFISRFGDRFTPDEVAGALPDLKRCGFEAFQLEIFHPDTIEPWIQYGIARVFTAATRGDLTVSQFVGHLLLNAFINEDALFSSWGYRETAAIVDALPVQLCPLVTVPIPSFVPPSDKRQHVSHWQRREDRLVEKLTIITGMIRERGFRVALEVMPGSLIGGVSGFLRLADRLESGGGSVGLNLDTGHIQATKESVSQAIYRLGPRILGTHLCDNWGMENLSLAPGTGGIEWPTLLSILRSTGYSGSYDIEIQCAAEMVDSQYDAARKFLLRALEEISEKEAV
jgi:sugar phosphate isomerase/epimerase